MATEGASEWHAAQKPSINPGQAWLLLLVALCGLAVYCALPYMSDEDDDPRQHPSSVADRGSAEATERPSTGEQGYLYVEGQKGLMPVGVERDDLDALTAAANAGDDAGVDELIAQNRAYKALTGTEVLVLETRFTTTKVRMMDGPSKGATGWVPYEWVHSEQHD